MKQIEKPDTFGHAIFCDDIREEQSKKLILVGVYRDIMLINGDFPFILNSFATHISYFERFDTCKDQVSLNIFFPGEEQPAVTVPVQIEELRERKSEIPDDPDFPAPRYHKVEMYFVANNVPIKKRGVIQVTVNQGDNIVEIGRLKVDKVGLTLTNKS